jgi:hypothetical protein
MVKGVAVIYQATWLTRSQINRQVYHAPTNDLRDRKQVGAICMEIRDPTRLVIKHKTVYDSMIPHGWHPCEQQLGRSSNGFSQHVCLLFISIYTSAVYESSWCTRKAD